MHKIILHMDMDAFFASIEQRDCPAYQGKPVIVGGTGKRGVVATASYEARTYGVRSAMPISEAKRRCSHGIFLPVAMERYQQVSRQVMQILNDYSPLVEQLSLDEAFLDISGMHLLYPNPLDIAVSIKNRIASELHLTISAGVAPNKFLAKLASDLKKPNGITIITPATITSILAPLPISRLWGVGSKTAARLSTAGIRTIGQLAATDKAVLVGLLGEHAATLHQLANGIDTRNVEPYQPHKSVGQEVTFEEDVQDRQTLTATLRCLADKVAYRLRSSEVQAKTITLKVRFAPFETLTRSVTLADHTNLPSTLHQQACSLLATLPTKPVRLIGITASNLSPAKQPSLFDDKYKEAALMRTLDNVRQKYGSQSITRLSSLKN